MPNLEYLLRILKEIDPENNIFDPIIDKIMVNVPKGIIILVLI